MAEAEPAFDLDFEQDILSRCLSDTDYLRTAAPILQTHHLGSKQLSWVWGVLQENWIKFAERPSAKVLLHRARADFIDSDERTSYLETVLKLRRREPEAPKSALDELRRFTRFVGYQEAMEEAVEALEEGNLDSVRDFLSTALRSDTVVGTYEVSRWWEEFEERQAKRKHRSENPDEIAHIPTGISGLDKIIRGVQPEELAIVMATTNRGKSIWLINIAYWAMMLGFKVCVVVTEMGVEQTATRMDARFTSMFYDRFRDWTFTPEELGKQASRFKKNKKVKDLLRLVKVPVGSSVLLAKQALDDMRAEMGGLDMAIFDSADHLQPSQNHKDFRLNQAQVYWDIKGMLQEEKWAGWSSTQAGREWATRTAKAEAASESYDKSRISDLMVTLNEPSKKSRVAVVEDDEEDVDPDAAHAPKPLLEGFIAKARDSAAKQRFAIETDLARMIMKGGAEVEAGEE